jgi:hypothetical protein
MVGSFIAYELYIAYLSLFFAPCFSAIGQKCNCQMEFTYVKYKIVKNYAGLSDRVNSKTKASYNRQTALAIEQSKSITKPVYCVAMMTNG